MVLRQCRLAIYKLGLRGVGILLLLVGLGRCIVANAASLGDFNYDDNGASIAIIGYTGGGGAVTIPDAILGKPVTSIGNDAFKLQTRLTSVTIPNSVTSIGQAAFYGCTGLTAITVDALNPAYSSLDGVLYDKSLGTLIQCPGGKSGSFSVPNSVTDICSGAFSGCTGLTSVTIPHSVTSIRNGTFQSCNRLTNVTIPNSVTYIGNSAFTGCTSLTSVTIPNSVTSIGESVFDSCTSLTSVTIGNRVKSIGYGVFQRCTGLTGIYFQGNAPNLVGSFGNNATIYYLPGTTRWSTSFGGRPTALWEPQVEASDASFGVRANQFGFNITWASGLVVVVEATTDLANPAWSSVGTNTLTGGSSYFSDSDWADHPNRFYRLRAP